MQPTSEQIARAMACATPEELVKNAAAAGFNVTIEQATAFLKSNQMIEISEDDIESVSGGCSYIDELNSMEISSSSVCKKCGSKSVSHRTDASGWTTYTCNDCGNKWRNNPGMS